MNRMLHNVTPEQMNIWRKKYGFKLIVDNDDHWDLGASHILSESYKENKVSEQIIAWIRIADLCTCTHERLAEEIYKEGENAFVFACKTLYTKQQGEELLQKQRELCAESAKITGIFSFAFS